MKVSNVVNSRFLAAHYLLQVLTFMAFFGLRLKYPPTDLLVLDVLGYTREFTIWLSLGMVIVVRLFSSPTPDAIVSHAFKFTKVAMLVISYYMSKSLPIVFAGIWIAIFTLFPQPRAKDPKIVQILNRGNFDQKITNNDYKGFWVVQFHATWSPLCTQLAPLFASIAQEYDHVRIKFGKVDVGLWPDLAEKHKINVAGTSSQLPSYVLFKIGKESNRYPALGADGKTVAEDISNANRNLIVANLSLKEVLEQAETWEEEAKKKFVKEQAKKKAT